MVLPLLRQSCQGCNLCCFCCYCTQLSHPAIAQLEDARFDDTASAVDIIVA